MSLLTQASLIVTPNGEKEGRLYSVVPNNSNGDFSVTRATTATRVNAAGLVELVPYNLVTYSNDLSSNWTLFQSTKTSGQADPFGGTNAIKLKYNTSSSYHAISRFVSLTGNNAHSVYAKAGELQFLQIASAQSVDEYANFNLGTGVIGTYGSLASNVQIENVGNGWYRCSVVFTNGSNGIYCAIANSASMGSFVTNTYAGANDTDGLFLYGAQVNAGSLLPYQATEKRLNIPRLDYSLGSCPNILLEPQRTNLALRSEEFDNATWGKAGVTITPNQAISPSGTNTMDLITFPLSGLSMLQTISVTSGATYTFSIWLSTQSGTQTIDIGNINVGVFQTITITTTPTRYEITQVASSATRFPGIRSTGAYSIFAWGAQLEAGAYATSYIPTSSASVTRNQDGISRTNIFTNGLITASGGTWFVDLRNNIAMIRDLTQGGIFINTGTAANTNTGFAIRQSGGSNQRSTIFKVEAGSGATIYNTLTDTAKIAIKWNGTTADVFVNGVKVVTATAFTATNMNNLIGEGQNRAIQFNSMALFPTPLTDGEMSMLTSGVYTPALAYAQLGLVSESPACLDSSVNALL
jgi:hypothetical protein